MADYSRQLGSQIAGALPSELDAWLALPRQGVPYHEGTIVPMIARRFRQRSDGLLVPASVAEDPQPIDLAATYLTASEVFGHPLRDEEFAPLLEGLGASGVVEACALLLEVHHKDASGLDQRLAQHALQQDARERALNLLRERQMRFVVPQLALLASSVVLLTFPWESDDDALVSDVVAAAVLHLHMGDLVVRPEGPNEKVLFGNVREGMALEVIANQMFNSTTNLGTDIARHERMWHHLAREVAKDEGLPDLSAVFETVTGMPLDVFEAVGFGFYAARDKAPKVPKSWFEPTDITEDQLIAVLGRTALTPGTLRQRLENDIDGDLSTNRWKLDAYSERPILDFDEQSWLIHSPQLLVDRFFSGLAFWDAYFHAGADQDHVRHAWGLITERYGHEVLESLAPEAAGQRVWRESEIQEAFGTQDQRNADAVIDYGDAWVVLDFSSRMPTRALAHAESLKALEDEIDYVVGDKASQLDATIAALKEGESRLTGRASQQRRRFHPVIVVSNKWPLNPITHELARLKVEEQGHLQGDQVETLFIITMEELEIVESVQEHGGPNFASLLRSHAEKSLRRMGLKDHVLLVEGLGVSRPRRMNALLESHTDRLVDAFGFEEEDPNGNVEP